MKKKTETKSKPPKKKPEVKPKINLAEFLSEEQMELYKDASPKRKVWLEMFFECGDPNKAAKIAYPGVAQTGIYSLSFSNRRYFNVGVADILRAQGINEVKIAEKINVLLDAKRKIRTYGQGKDHVEIEEEDSFAIDKGIAHSTKLLNIDPAQKVLLGEDKDNPMNSLLAAFKMISNTKKVEQKPEEPPEPTKK